MTDYTGNVTQLLEAAAAAEPGAADALMRTVEQEIRSIAEGKLRHERAGHTLETGDLLDLCWGRLFGKGPVRFESRSHFYGAAAEAIRRILIEHARAKHRDKRPPPDKRVPFDAVDPPAISKAEPAVETERLDRAITRLELERPRLAQVVKLRYFAELGWDAVAAAAGVSVRQATNDWNLARALMHGWMLEMTDEPTQ